MTTVQELIQTWTYILALFAAIAGAAIIIDAIAAYWGQLGLGLSLLGLAAIMCGAGYWIGKASGEAADE